MASGNDCQAIVTTCDIAKAFCKSMVTEMKAETGESENDMYTRLYKNFLKLVQKDINNSQDLVKAQIAISWQDFTGETISLVAIPISDVESFQNETVFDTEHGPFAIVSTMKLRNERLNAMRANGEYYWDEARRNRLLSPQTATLSTVSVFGTAVLIGGAIGGTIGAGLGILNHLST